MFPVPEKPDLSIGAIADYWSREMSSTRHELLETIIRGWWRGHFQDPTGTHRLEALKILFSEDNDSWIVFVIDGVNSPPIEVVRDDDRIDVDLRLRVPLPNHTPETWTEDNCADAFDVLGKDWTEDMCEELVVGLSAMTVARADFMNWIDRSDFAAPKFWGQKRQHKAPSKPLTEKVTVRFVDHYLRDVKPTATMAETEDAVRDYAHAAGRTAHRPWVRQAYGEIQREAGLKVRPGRRGNPPA